MYKGRRILLVAPAFNEEKKIGEVVRRAPRDVIDTVLVVDDGSTDTTADVAQQHGAAVIRLGSVEGVGAAIRRGFEFAREGRFDVVVVIAGNNKDSPEEIRRLLDPICDADFDFVMGSRYLAGGAYGGDMAAYRKLATRLHPILVGIFCGRRITESTNGYRAMKVGILNDRRINLAQSWLDGYELEVYLLMKLLRLGYRCTEVPVSKIYPPRAVGNTKMRPVLDWWNILRPIFLVGLGLRR
jgi:dolichol-phosphate mannosyltransferase